MANDQTRDTSTRLRAQTAARRALLALGILLAVVPAASAAPTVVAAPRVRAITSVIRVGQHNELLLKSLEVYGVFGRQLRVTCNRCRRDDTPLRTSFPTLDTRLYTNVDWYLPAGRTINVRVWSLSEIGRYLVLASSLTNKPALVFKSSGCLATLTTTTPCPRGTPAPTPGAPIPQAPPPPAPATYIVTVAFAGAGSGTVTPSGPGRVPASDNCPSPLPSGSACRFGYAAGSVATLSPVPAAGSTFTGWSGACTGTGPCAPTVGGPLTLTATFAPSGPSPPFKLIIDTVGYGSVVANGGNPGPDGYPAGATATLTATPAAGSTFVGWSGPCSGTATCTVTFESDVTVTATFAVTPAPVYLVSLLLTGTGNGTVNQSTTGRVNTMDNCPSPRGPGVPCSLGYTAGSVVTFSETAPAGSVFTGWSGACSGTGACEVTVNGPVSLSANFELAP